MLFAGSYTTAGMGQLERDPAGQEPAGQAQLDRDRLFARDRFSTDRVFLCVYIFAHPQVEYVAISSASTTSICIPVCCAQQPVPKPPCSNYVPGRQAVKLCLSVHPEIALKVVIQIGDSEVRWIKR